MSMYKKSASVFKIVFKSFSTFIYKLPQFLKYIAYPVFGQLLGLWIVFSPFLMASNPKNVYLPMVVVALIAGLIIFCHSFWKFLLVSGGLVLISKQIVENEPLKEFRYYTEIFQKRTKDYIIYLLLLCLITLAIVAGVLFVAAVYAIANNVSVPGLTVPIAGCTVLLILIMPLFSTITLQTFVLNQNLTPYQSIVKAAGLTLRYYFQSWGVLVLIYSINILWSLMIDYFVKTFVFTQAVYEQHADISNMVEFLQAYTAGTFVSLFAPFVTLALTWWYLRIAKERGIKQQQRVAE